MSDHLPPGFIELACSTGPGYCTYTAIIPDWKDNDRKVTFLMRGPCGVTIKVPEGAFPPGTVITIEGFEPQTGDHEFFEVSLRLKVSTGGKVPALPILMDITHCLNSTTSWDFSLLTKEGKDGLWYPGGRYVDANFGAASELGHFVFETSRIGDWILVFDPLCDKIERTTTTISTAIKKWDRFSLLPLIGSLIWDVL